MRLSGLHFGTKFVALGVRSAWPPRNYWERQAPVKLHRAMHPETDR